MTLPRIFLSYVFPFFHSLYPHFIRDNKFQQLWKKNANFAAICKSFFTNKHENSYPENSHVGILFYSQIPHTRSRENSNWIRSIFFAVIRATIVDQKSIFHRIKLYRWATFHRDQLKSRGTRKKKKQKIAHKDNEKSSWFFFLQIITFKFSNFNYFIVNCYWGCTFTKVEKIITETWRTTFVIIF